MWKNYHDVLDYLRRNTSPETRVANASKLSDGMNGPTARVSLFPSSAMSWLAVDPNALALYIAAVQRPSDSVVVWSPGETSKMNVWNPKRFGIEEVDLRPLFDEIRRHFVPEARFGDVEVWRRKP